MTAATRTRPEVVHACVDCAALPTMPLGLPLGDSYRGVDYRPPAPRPAPHGGPRSRRCTTHHRAHTAAGKARTRTGSKARKFGLAPELQQALWTFQGGRCPCGAKVSHTVPAGVHTDHDHDLARGHDHPDDRGCPECVLGFLCAACNRDVIGRFTGRRGGRADVPTILRALANFLDDPPLPRLLAEQARTERTAS